MKKAKVEATEPVKTRKKGCWITTQLVDEEILVLNIYENRILTARHCINIDTGEYATLQGKIWSTTKEHWDRNMNRDIITMIQKLKKEQECQKRMKNIYRIISYSITLMLIQRFKLLA